MNRDGFEDPRKFLARHGLRPKESFGQCFLTAEPVARAIVEALAPGPDETVVEIGAGPGTLTRMLARRSRRVVAIERDRELVRGLLADDLPPNVEVEEADAVTWDYATVAAQEPTVIVGNLPYQITGRLLRAIQVQPIRWRVAVVMVQREVADRLLARPGDDTWGALSVFAQAGCEVERVTRASPGCFHPAPKVHSTVVKLVPLVVPRALETGTFQTLVHALFAARRKMLRNGLSGIVPREAVTGVCESAGIDPGLRPETLSPEALARLAVAIDAWRAG